MNRYIIEKSSTQTNSWVLTDTEKGVVITFEDGRYDETMHIDLPKDASREMTNEVIIQTVREMCDWVARHHGSKCFRQPYGFEFSEDDTRRYFYRRKSPRWRMEIQEGEVELHRLASSLRKAAEFLIKRNNYER
ncbi:DNA breaking-rejoining protein [Prevotella sp. oral taxon 376]|uniref:DNA breaking-rejoining protein n=1 Tax=Prevotella sp. oral taxon 376 TaxID=712466 RepID=UPI0018EEB479|nr:DNA breaking-rejoining protein [Prevotella sp. oral taxon 376]